MLWIHCIGQSCLEAWLPVGTKDGFGLLQENWLDKATPSPLWTQLARPLCILSVTYNWCLHVYKAKDPGPSEQPDRWQTPITILVMANAEE